MVYSARVCWTVLLLAFIAACAEWLAAGASWAGLALWVIPAIYLFDGLVYSWPGQIASLETLWIVLIYSDSAQLVVGRRFGRTPAVPSISPNKSVEGYVGGLIAAFAVGKFLHGWPSVPLAVILVSGVIGDLYFSFFKRLSGIKDFSSVLGAHGGICDRIDSFAFAYLGLCLWGALVDKKAREGVLLHNNTVL
jgi:CDP-diglyceride synthetase